MSLLSNIIKSGTVVDRRGGPDEIPGEAVSGAPVIKRGVVLVEPKRRLPRSVDAYQDELNRLQVDVLEAEDERRKVRSQLDAERRELKRVATQRAELEKMEGINITEESLRMLEEARADAEKIRQEARDGAAPMIEELRHQGYLDGLEQGAGEARTQVREETSAAVEALGRLMEELSGLREELVKQSESEILDLILTVAEKVVGRQVQLEPQTVVDMLRDVMEQNRREEYVKIIVSKDLMPVEAKVSDKVKEIITTLAKQVDIYVDSEGHPGELLVETPNGITDLSVGTQMENITQTLQEAVGSEE